MKIFPTVNSYNRPPKVKLLFSFFNVSAHLVRRPHDITDYLSNKPNNWRPVQCNELRRNLKTIQ